jgi:hypothetical protein
MSFAATVRRVQDSPYGVMAKVVGGYKAVRLESGLHELPAIDDVALHN